MSNLIGKNIVVYDLETKKIPDECSRGWQSLDEMGISVACSYDYRSDRYRVYLEDNLSKLIDRLNEEGTLLVGFNTTNFDDKVFRACGFKLKDFRELNSYDMLKESKIGAKSFSPEKGFKLDDHLRCMKIPMKSGNGAFAPALYKAGKMGELISYCLDDVFCEKSLFDKMISTKLALCAARATPYSIRVPKEAVT